MFTLSSAKISDDLLFSRQPQISNFPSVFPVSVHFPLFRENYYFPLLSKISPLFLKNSPAFYIFYVFSPYFDHDAFMHHPMHVLDAPGLGRHTLYAIDGEGRISRNI